MPRRGRWPPPSEDEEEANAMECTKVQTTEQWKRFWIYNLMSEKEDTVSKQYWIMIRQKDIEHIYLIRIISSNNSESIQKS